MSTVTIAAPHGANSTAVAIGLGLLLGLPVVDRAIPSRVAEELAVPLADALEHDERIAGGLGGLLARYAAPIAASGGTALAWPPYADEEAYRNHVEGVISEEADRGAVIVGRAAAFVLGDRPDVLHVRLTGPEHDRILRIMLIDEVDEAEARHRVHQTDHARAVYVRHFYHRKWDDPSAFHLIVTSTALSVPTCVETIATAARGRFQAVRLVRLPGWS
jgi:cytidylate kinase